MDYPQLFYTVSSKEIRPTMPDVPVLLSAASFTRQRRNGSYYLHPPRLPSHISQKGADCGGFVATVRWGGTYRFRPRHYVQWLASWRPQWAATMDLCCFQEQGEYPSSDIVQQRQQFTTDMAWIFWECFREVNWCWCPSIQGYHVSEFEQHAKVLKPLIRAMAAYYSDPGSCDEETEQQPSAFRVGIGSLCGRASARLVHEIVRVVAEILGRDIPLHLWGAKLKLLQSPLQLQGAITLDTGAWNGLFGYEHERRRASGLSEVDYSWQMQKHYARKVEAALDAPKQMQFVYWPDQ